MDVLYHNNIFAFDHLDTVLNFRQTTLRSRLNTIRTICLQWRFRSPLEDSPIPSPHDEATWQEVCAILASLVGIQAIYVHLRGRGVESEKDNYGPVLKPLYQITHVKTFKVIVRWAQVAYDEFNCKSDSKPPFELVGNCIFLRSS